MTVRFDSIETKNSKADSNSENRFFGIDLKIVIRVREKGNSYLMSTELGKMPSDVAFLSSLHPCGANRGSWIQNL